MRTNSRPLQKISAMRKSTQNASEATAAAVSEASSVAKDKPAKRKFKPAPSEEKAERRGIQSVEIGFTVLDAIRKAGGPISLSKIAEVTGLAVANTHYYMVSFQRVGLVQQDSDTGHYGLGTYALKLGVAALEQFDVYKLARPAMADISSRTGHTVFLGVWGNKGPTIVYRVAGGRSLPLLELRVGSVLPLLTSALGRNFLAHLPSTMTEAMVKEELAVYAPAIASSSKSDVPRTLGEVVDMCKRIKMQGYSQSRDSLLPNFTALSAPVFDLSGAIIAAMTVMGPTHLLKDQSEVEVLTLLRHYAVEISQTAGIYG
ncbi:IclR family transcriptional regulator [Variovorax boronicumulans]|uniref:IclR family transcriptional regulator n=1 Tax=Variovorax boronicumulans TaxID=436515 RepID=UPI002783E8EB|nr:IclR family transcriptional regulator [Variovorax boronicumulans]MDQ0044703.1 DNA-binding IclR family transcriptional regulator [Variovorax boronicumulans]